MADMVSIVTYFAFLLGFGVVVANLMKKVKIPDAFFLLLVGLAFGPTIWKNPAVTAYLDFTPVDVSAMSVVPDFLRTLALIMVVFSGAFNLDIKKLKKFSDISVNLAFVGVLFNTVVLGLIANLIFPLDLITSLLLGAIISGTAPSVVFTFEDSLKKQKDTLTILEVESVLNSPLCVLIPVLFLEIYAMAPGSILEPNIYISQFWQMVAAGIGTGVVIGLAITKLLRGMLKEYSPLLIFSIALITYAMAENVGGSGMLAVATSGLIIGGLVFPHKEAVREFHDEMSEMLRISVFTLIGAQIYLYFSIGMLFRILLFFLLVLLARPVFVELLLRQSKMKTDFGDRFLLRFVAPRGIAAAAMAPIAAAVLGNELILSIVFVVILLSVFSSTLAANLASTGRVSNIEKMLEERRSRAKTEIKRALPEEKEEYVEELLGEDKPKGKKTKREG